MNYFQLEFTPGAQQLESSDHNNVFLLMMNNTVILFYSILLCSNFGQKCFHCLQESKIHLAIEIHYRIL